MQIENRSCRKPVARADRAKRWRQVPWSLWAYVILTTGGMVVVVAIASAPVAPSVFFVGFILAWNCLLLRGLRWLWIGTTVLSACFFGIDLLTGTGTWYGDVLGLIELGLLLAPPTRRFFGTANPPPVLESVP